MALVTPGPNPPPLRPTALRTTVFPGQNHCGYQWQRSRIIRWKWETGFVRLRVQICKVLGLGYHVYLQPFTAVRNFHNGRNIPEYMAPEGLVLFYRNVIGHVNQGFESMGRRVSNNEEAYTLGSRPPNCDHKCGVCRPCDAIQVPATTDHVRVQYANYEPEGWKCKCGTYFFNP
ncbi:hypothetical protein RHMOL_Rhmol03G0255400 [Rhododendron molle]|uniref:Uncharacterized protein n=1 Tax=Rhododendron molle TaxID=49168 RepID=A0ACC0PKQ3_RHOML|nr:hypothetical protein RHMOL_Rhmol03G0255400 [Rhododendron molle]